METTLASMMKRKRDGPAEGPVIVNLMETVLSVKKVRDHMGKQDESPTV